MDDEKDNDLNKGVVDRQQLLDIMHNVSAGSGGFVASLFKDVTIGKAHVRLDVVDFLGDAIIDYLNKAPNKRDTFYQTLLFCVRQDADEEYYKKEAQNILDCIKIIRSETDTGLIQNLVDSISLGWMKAKISVVSLFSDASVKLQYLRFLLAVTWSDYIDGKKKQYITSGESGGVPLKKGLLNYDMLTKEALELYDKVDKYEMPNNQSSNRLQLTKIIPYNSYAQTSKSIKMDELPNEFKESNLWSGVWYEFTELVNKLHREMKDAERAAAGSAESYANGQTINTGSMEQSSKGTGDAGTSMKNLKGLGSKIQNENNLKSVLKDCYTITELSFILINQSQFYGEFVKAEGAKLSEETVDIIQLLASGFELHEYDKNPSIPEQVAFDNILRLGRDALRWGDNYGHVEDNEVIRAIFKDGSEISMKSERSDDTTDDDDEYFKIQFDEYFKDAFKFVKSLDREIDLEVYDDEKKRYDDKGGLLMYTPTTLITTIVTTLVNTFEDDAINKLKTEETLKVFYEKFEDEIKSTIASIKRNKSITINNVTIDDVYKEKWIMECPVRRIPALIKEALGIEKKNRVTDNKVEKLIENCAYVYLFYHSEEELPPIIYEVLPKDFYIGKAPIITYIYRYICKNINTDGYYAIRDPKFDVTPSKLLESISNLLDGDVSAFLEKRELSINWIWSDAEKFSNWESRNPIGSMTTVEDVKQYFDRLKKIVEFISGKPSEFLLTLLTPNDDRIRRMVEFIPKKKVTSIIFSVRNNTSIMDDSSSADLNIIYGPVINSFNKALDEVMHIIE